jgi:hypothetical protein
MFERSIPPREVKSAILNGEVVEHYPDDSPYPSFLMAVGGAAPLHVVVAREAGSQTVIVITAYRPDPKLWSDDFRWRRKK